MSTTYKIAEVAKRSGFNPSTLRYYEELGLVPPVARTPAGYRLYDDSTLARLAFISRAKQLGCSLEEITDLAVAWEGERCEPIQVRLRGTHRGQDHRSPGPGRRADRVHRTTAACRRRPRPAYARWPVRRRLRVHPHGRRGRPSHHL